MTTGTFTLRPGQAVRLAVDHPVTPDRLRGAAATVESIEPYGAVVQCEAAGSGRYRALAEELTPLLAATGDVCDYCGGMNMIRAGACMVCLECGTAGGCG